MACLHWCGSPGVYHTKFSFFLPMPVSPEKRLPSPVILLFIANMRKPGHHG